MRLFGANHPDFLKPVKTYTEECDTIGLDPLYCRAETCVTKLSAAQGLCFSTLSKCVPFLENCRGSRIVHEACLSHMMKGTGHCAMSAPCVKTLTPTLPAANKGK